MSSLHLYACVPPRRVVKIHVIGHLPASAAAARVERPLVQPRVGCQLTVCAVVNPPCVGCLFPREAGWSTPHLASSPETVHDTVCQHRGTTKRGIFCASAAGTSRIPCSAGVMGHQLPSEFHSRFLNSLVKPPLDDGFF